MCGERVCVPPREKMARKREDEVIDVSEWSRVVDYERNENQESTKEKASIHCSRCTFDNLSSAVLCAVCSSPLYAHENATRMVDVLASSANNTMQDGLVAMIDAALQRQQQQTNFRNGKRQRGNLYNFRLCSNLTPHITQQGVLDGVHWSCGYRNIQMLCYALQRLINKCSSEYILFNNAGDIPDVAGIQLWIEKAWEAGFDKHGKMHFEGRLFGSDEWIGATECAALLRYRGIRANIVDFYLKEGSDQTQHLETSDNNNLKQPKCSVMQWVKCYFDMKHPFQHPCVSPYYVGSCDKNHNSSAEVELPPLFFQQHGHSRTIIGYEERGENFYLLLFDPSGSGVKLRSKLEQGTGWQCLVKRGEHTLRHSLYQIVYIAPGSVLVPGDSKYENGKVLTSTVIRY